VWRIAPRGRGGGGRRTPAWSHLRAESLLLLLRLLALARLDLELFGGCVAHDLALSLGHRDARRVHVPLLLHLLLAHLRDEHALLLLLAVAQVLLRVHPPDGVLLLLIPQLVLHELPLLELLLQLNLALALLHHVGEQQL
jgi:hypothetical protein